MDDPIHIDDLATPTFTPDVEAIFGFMATMADDCPLDAATLHRKAADDTGLSDFGDRDYEERLDVLLAALRDVGGLTSAGQVTFHVQLLQLLKNRLLLTDLLRRHPEIPEAPLAPPLVIAGLPRTGTTHLHNLLAADPAFRTLPYWESNEPFAMPAEVGVEPDPRWVRTDLAVAFMNQSMPLFPLMHEMTTDHVHEEIALLAVDFSTMYFETFAHVPAWHSYYRDHDQAPHYRYLRVVLQALQHERPAGERWLLKSPQHLEQLPVLAEVFPDATVVLTHRDPVAVSVSMATMVAYTSRTHTDHVDVHAVADAWVDRVDDLLTACRRDRDVLGLDRSLDVRFDDFMADDLAVARRIYELADQPFTPESDRATAAYLAGHQRGRLGRLAYDPEQLGLDVDALQERFAPYVARFLS